MTRSAGLVVVAVLAAASVLIAPGAPRRRVAPVVARRRLPRPSLLDHALAGWRRRGLEGAYEAALPGVLEAASGHLRSGASLRSALVEAGRSAPGASLVPLVDPLARGVPMADAVDAWARARTDRSTRLAAAAVGLAATTGGGAARSLDAVATTLRDRQALTHEVRAQSAQARLSATVVGVSPMAFAFLAAGLDARTLVFLVTPPLGLGCLAGGVGLDLLGLWWMRHLLRGATR